jgi:hypothetical protein
MIELLDSFSYNEYRIKENAMIENPETIPSQQTPPPLKRKSAWKKIAIGCGIALILFICCAALVGIAYLERDKIPGLDNLLGSSSSHANGDLIAFASNRDGNWNIYNRHYPQ